MSILSSDPILVAGGRGMVGSAIVRALKKRGYKNILRPSSRELNLRDPRAVNAYFAKHTPAYVFLAAAKVGGILANSKMPVEFLTQNLEIELAVIGAAHKHAVQKLLFLGSSCIYPKHAAQPLKEEYLLTGALEPTNDAYALAKIAGIKLCEAYRDEYGDNFISAMPTNLYGVNDNFHPEHSHVLPALIRRFHEAKEAGLPEVVAWGTGSPLREFLYVDDLADACIFLMETYEGRGTINIGTGEEISIKALTELVAQTVGYDGAITWDTTKPDGTPRKLLDVSRIHALGWKHSTSLHEGLRATYNWYRTAAKKRT